MHILLVDDNDLFREIMTEIMFAAGFTVVDAPDGESALMLASPSRPPEILISDINLGYGMDGFALAKIARFQWPTISVLLISGIQTNFAGHHCGRAEHFLTKPFTTETLLQVISSLEPRIPHA